MGLVSPMARSLFRVKTAARFQPAKMEQQAPEYVWDNEVSVPERLIRYIDDGVRLSEALPPDLSARAPCVDKMKMPGLPPGTTCHRISPSGKSYWARTAKIGATDGNGQPTALFIKAGT
jgi:hypothetical protein